MGYQQRGGSPRDSGRGRGIPRHEKAKVKKLKYRPHRLIGSQVSRTPTPEEIVNRTVNALNHLGNQRFILSPFSEQLNLWLTTLKNVLSEFESSLGIAVDEQFTRECTQIVSDIQMELGKRRDKEAHSGEMAKVLSERKMDLEKIERDYGAASEAFKKHEETETKALSVRIEDIKKELERVAKLKVGIFRGVSKAAKAQKEEEARRRLAVAETELKEATGRLDAEQERIRAEYETKKEAVTKQVQWEEKEILSQEIDGSLDARHAACDSLVKAVNSFLYRSGLFQEGG